MKMNCISMKYENMLKANRKLQPQVKIPYFATGKRLGWNPGSKWFTKYVWNWRFSLPVTFRMRMAKWKEEEEPGEVKSIRIKSSLKSERKKTLAAARLTFWKGLNFRQETFAFLRQIDLPEKRGEEERVGWNLEPLRNTRIEHHHQCRLGT